MSAHEIQGLTIQAFVQIMVTAGGREDDLNPPRDGLVNDDVGGNIAGVEGDDHVNRLSEIVFCYVGTHEGQSLHAEIFCDSVTIFDDLCLHIHADHTDVPSLDDGEIMIHGKGEIAFSATQIADVECSVLGEMTFYVADQLKETVDLPEFGLLFVMNASALIADTQFLQKKLLTV